MQKLRMTFALAAVSFAVIAGAGAPTAAAPLPTEPLSSIKLADQMDNGMQNVHYGYRYCRRWRWRCAERWGWHTRRFHRCLWRHGC